MEHCAKKISEKKPQNVFKTRFDDLGTILGVVWFLKIFLKHFEDSTLLGTLGKKNFSKKLPQNMFKTRFDTFGIDFGHFWNFANFLIFWNHFKDSTFHGTLGKKIFQKNYPKACSNHVWTNWERFWAFFEFWKFFKNISKTRPCLEHWAKKVSRKNYPKTCSKHVWTLLGTILIIFGILQNFWFFETISKTRPSMEHCAKKNFRKKYPKKCAKQFWTIWERLRAFSEFWNFLKLFKNISKTRPSMDYCAKKFSKKIPQNVFKTRLDNLGTISGVFWILKIFLKPFEDSTLLGTLDKKNSRKNYPKTRSKRFSTLLGTILGIFGVLKNFWFFKNISKTRHSLEHWAKKFFKKITPKHVQNTFGQTGNDFGRFLNFENFLKHFEDSTLLGTLGKKNFSKKLPQNMFKTRFDTFGNDFGHFWNFSFFFDFLKPFQRLDPPWNTGQKNFRKIYPKIRSKHFSTLLGTILGIFGVLKNFWFFKNISKTRHSLEHWAKKFFKKITPKHVQNTFGQTGNDFGRFLNFEIFLKHFEDSTLLGTLGKKIFSKKLPQNTFKILLDSLGTILGDFGILKVFWFFENISNTRPSMEHWAKRNFRKKYPKTCSKHFWTIWERF